MNFHWQEVLGTIVVWTTASYALNTLPVPDNKWARWLVGVLQFVVANQQKALESFKPKGDGDAGKGTS